MCKSKVQTGQWLLHFYSKDPEKNDFNLTKNSSMSVSVEGVADNVEMLIMECASAIWCTCNCFCFDIFFYFFFVTSILCLFSPFGSTEEVAVFCVVSNAFRSVREFSGFNCVRLISAEELEALLFVLFCALVWHVTVCMFDFEHQIKSLISWSTESFNWSSCFREKQAYVFFQCTTQCC